MDLLKSVFSRKYWDYVRNLSAQELRTKYFGNVFGPVWMVVHPVCLMALYVVLFAYVFPARFSGAGYDDSAAVFIISGLLPWFLLLEVINQSPAVFTSNANLVKQVVFPIEVLPTKTVVIAFVSHLIFMTLLVALKLIMGGGFSWLVLLIPVLLFLQFVGLIGVSLVLSTVGVFFKDLKEIISVFSTFGLFASPILFLPQTLAAVPQLQYVFYFNPVSIYVWCYQDAFAFGRIEHPWAWILVVPLTLLIFFTGVRCYSRFRQFLPSFV